MHYSLSMFRNPPGAPRREHATLPAYGTHTHTLPDVGSLHLFRVGPVLILATPDRR